MRIILPILANIFLFAGAWGYGSLLRKLWPTSFRLVDRLAFTLLGGLGIQGTILFCAGQVWFSRSAIVVILSLGLMLGARSLIRTAREIWEARKGISWAAIPAAIVLGLLLVTAVGGLALPMGDMNSDALAYHYPGPKVWLRHGVIRPLADESLTYFPVVMETQFAALMSLGGERGPGFFSVTAFCSLLLMTVSLARRLKLDATATWWVLAILATMPAAYRGTYDGYIDAVFAGFVLAAARLAFDSEETKDYLLFGIFCGITMGAKYTGLLAWMGLIFCSLLISLVSCKHEKKLLLKNLALACAVAILVAAPCYLRNWILYGSPIYPPTPLILKFFKVKNITPAVMQEILNNVIDTGGGMGRGFLNFLLLPFNLTYHTSNFRGAGGIGLVPWALAPFGIIARRGELFAKGLLLFSFFELASWFATAQVSRYLIPVYVVGAVFGVIGWQYVRERSSGLGRMLAAVVVAISILYGLAMILPSRAEDIHATLSNTFESERRYREIPGAASFDFLNHDASVKKVLILDPYVAAYFLDKEYIKPFGRWKEQTIPGVTNVSEVMVQLPRMDVTHILDVKYEKGYFDLPANPPGLALVFETEDQRVYRVN